MTVGNSHQHGVCWSILSDRASRAMAYVGMTRGRDENHLAIYPVITNEAHQHHHGTDTGIHQTHRGTKHAAAHALRTMLTANDDRAATMHTVAARTDRELLPAAVAALLDRNDQRRTDRAQAWRQHTAQNLARDAAYQRLTATTQRAAQRQRSRSRDQGYGLNFKTRNGCSPAAGQRRLRSLCPSGYRPLTLPSAATNPETRRVSRTSSAELSSRSASDRSAQGALERRMQPACIFSEDAEHLPSLRSLRKNACWGRRSPRLLVGDHDEQRPDHRSGHRRQPGTR